MAEEPTVDATEFRRALARWATGVSVVTAREGDLRAGLTVNAFLSVSLAPPLLLVSLSEDADTTPVVERSGWFGVSVLRADQRAVSERFARTVPPSEKFEGLAFHDGAHGVPLVDGGLAAFVCRLERTVEVADHHLEIGRAVALERHADGLPLTYFASRYGEAVAADRLRLLPPP